MERATSQEGLAEETVRAKGRKALARVGTAAVARKAVARKVDTKAGAKVKVKAESEAAKVKGNSRIMKVVKIMIAL